MLKEILSKLAIFTPLVADSRIKFVMKVSLSGADPGGCFGG